MLMQVVAQIGLSVTAPQAQSVYISPDDYPAASVAPGAEGQTTVRLNFDDRGRVARCTLVASSGHPALDQTTCWLLQRRARIRLTSPRQQVVQHYWAAPKR